MRRISIALATKFHKKAYLRGFTKNYNVNEPSGSFCIISRWVILSETAVGGERRILIMRSFTSFRMTGQKLSDPSNKLVYYEVFADIVSARGRERQIKGWRREKKIRLIESMNPKWMDLYNGLKGFILKDSS